MATIQAIFAQLGADSSVLIQFVIVLLMFLLLKFVFLGKLQFVIENREEKTVKLENSADEIFEKVNKITREYNEKIDAAKISSFQKFNTETDKIAKENNKLIKEKENEVAKYVETSREVIKKEVQQKEKEILTQSEELSKTLLAKLTK